MVRRRKAPPRSGVWGARSKPRLAYCHSCRRQVLSAHWDAQPRRFDPQPLTPLGETVALLLGLRTFWVVGGNLWSRNSEAIKQSPAGTGGLVFRDHRCELPQPTGDSVNFKKSDSYEKPGF